MCGLALNTLGNKIVEKPRTQVDRVFITVLGQGRKPLIQVSRPPDSLMGGRGRQCGSHPHLLTTHFTRGHKEKPSHALPPPPFPAVMPSGKRLLAI